MHTVRQSQIIEMEHKYAYKRRMDLLTTNEAADYLRMGERKLYELVSSGAIPCTKVSGKWLFPRDELDRWVLSGLVRPAGMIASNPPPIIGGSQDALLEWSLRESGSGLATLSEGTESGVGRLLRGEVIAAAVHYHHADTGDDANIEAVKNMSGFHDAVLVGFARREQGLLVSPGNPKQFTGLSDAIEKGARMAVRQAGAGAQMLLDVSLKRLGTNIKNLRLVDPPCLTGPDLASAVRNGHADCGIATRAAAKSGGLDFVPLVWEHFDLLTRQRFYFQQPLQSLFHSQRSERFIERATQLSGYDVSQAGKIRYAS